MHQGVRPIEKVVVLSIHGYVSICRRLCCALLYKIRCESRASGATQALGLRWGFETTST